MIDWGEGLASHGLPQGRSIELVAVDFDYLHRKKVGWMRFYMNGRKEWEERKKQRK